MARAGLGLSITDLAKAASVGISTVARFESEKAVPIPSTVAAMRRALEDMGAVFLADGEMIQGGQGVRLRSSALPMSGS